MMKRAMTGALLALATALATVFALPTDARAATYSVSVSAADVTQETWECPCPGASVGLTATVSGISAFLYYDYEIIARGPAGTISARWTGRKFMPEYVREPLALTPGIDEYGTYTLEATVQFYGPSDTLLETKTATDSFTFSGPPPPPEPPAYASQIGGHVYGKPLWTKRIRSFSATVQSESRGPRQGEIGVPATARILVGNKARAKAATAMTWNQTDKLTVTLPQKKRTRKYLVQVEINGQVAFSRYCKVKGTKHR